jgi:hypothetical protein
MKIAWAIPAAAMAATTPSWDIQLAPNTEPGSRLVVMGHVRMDRGTPGLAGVHVYAYHADGHGYYALPGHEKEGPRLAGTAVTNERGEYRLRTVVPGAYGGGPPHIHFEVWGKGMPRKAFVMNLMPIETSKPPPDTASLYERYALRRQAHLSPVTGYQLLRDEKGVLHGAYEIFWKWGMLVPGPNK